MCVCAFVCVSLFACKLLLLPASFWLCFFAGCECERKSINFYLIFISCPCLVHSCGLACPPLPSAFSLYSPFVLRLCYGSQSCLCDHPVCLSVCLGLFGFLHDAKQRTGLETRLENLLIITRYLAYFHRVQR